MPVEEKIRLKDETRNNGGGKGCWCACRAIGQADWSKSMENGGCTRLGDEESAREVVLSRGKEEKKKRGNDEKRRLKEKKKIEKERELVMIIGN